MSKVFNMVGGGGVTASIFVTGLSETDTVTATKGAKTLAGKWMQKPNPLAHGLPDGYTELEYIESTGTQYIDTGVSPTQGLGCFFKFKFNDIASNTYLCGAFEANSVRYTPIMVESSSLVGIKSQTYNDYIYYKKPGDTQVHELKFNVNGNSVEFDGEVVGTVGDIGYSANKPIYIFSRNYQGPDAMAKANIYNVMLYSSDGTPVKNYIPAKRNSDGAVGMYDLVTNSFFENAGTGTFTAGEEVPQTISYFLIKPIREFGTWTVTATDGTKTVTQDVLVDVITEYKIEMYLYRQYLYKSGTSFVSFSQNTAQSGMNRMDYFSNGSGTVTFESDHIEMKSTVTSSGGYAQKSLYASTDMTNFSKLCFKTEVLNKTNQFSVFVGNDNFQGKSPWDTCIASKLFISVDLGVYELDISAITGTKYILFLNNAVNTVGTQTLKIYDVWLE